MALLKTSNPALSGDAFRVGGAVLDDGMTISGTVNKTGILLICVVATAAWSWNLFTRSPQAALPLLSVGGIGGFIVALVTIFKKAWSPVTAPMYALLEGLVLGSASAMLEVRFPGIAMQAVGLTFGTLVALLIAYRSGIIRATEQFKMGVVAATGGIADLLFDPVCAGVLWLSLRSHQWLGRDRDRFQCCGGDRRCTQPGFGFRSYRERSPRRRPEVHGMVRRLRFDGHSDLAVL